MYSNMITLDDNTEDIGEIIKSILAETPEKEIHSTIGVYSNGSMKYNGVAAEGLEEHIWYNVTSRPGRALFLDGGCIIKGVLSYEIIKKHEGYFKKNPHTPKEVSKKYV